MQQRKLGGILIESVTRPAGGISAVIGIGINLRLLKPVAELIDQPVENLIPNYFRSDIKNLDKSRLAKSDFIRPKPVVQNISKGFDIEKGLHGHNIALWHSHGWSHGTAIASRGSGRRSLKYQ